MGRRSKSDNVFLMIFYVIGLPIIIIIGLIQLIIKVINYFLSKNDSHDIRSLK